MKAIIIDDESLARELIKAYLKKFDQIEVIAECADGFEGLKAIQQHGPDLIFLDVQMPKITGFEMLELIDNPPVVIFSTAFDQYAIKAFELSAVDYLLKPYSESRFEEAVKKAIARVGQQSEQKQKLDKLQESRAEQDTLDRMVVKTGNKIQILSLKQIHHFEQFH